MVKKLINDLRNIKKLRRERNTLENKYQATNLKYIELLEQDRSMLNENINLKETIKELKKEIKDLKKEINEDGK